MSEGCANNFINKLLIGCFEFSSILVSRWINRVCKLEMGRRSKSMSLAPGIKAITRNSKLMTSSNEEFASSGSFVASA